MMNFLVVRSAFENNLEELPPITTVFKQQNSTMYAAPLSIDFVADISSPLVVYAKLVATQSKIRASRVVPSGHST